MIEWAKKEIRFQLTLAATSLAVMVLNVWAARLAATNGQTWLIVLNFVLFVVNGRSLLTNVDTLWVLWRMAREREE